MTMATKRLLCWPNGLTHLCQHTNRPAENLTCGFQVHDADVQTVTFHYVNCACRLVVTEHQRDFPALSMLLNIIFSVIPVSGIMCQCRHRDQNQANTIPPTKKKKNN